MPRPSFRRLLATLGLVAAVTIAQPAGAGEPAIALGEVSVTDPSPGVDPASLRTAAEGEIRDVDARGIKRRVIVAMAVLHASEAPVACTVTAMVRDKKSGAMIAVIEGRATSEGGGTLELKKAVLRAAVRTAVRQIPDALSGG